MGKNSDAIGVILLLLLVSGALGNNGGGTRRPLFEGFEPVGMINNFHRMVETIDRKSVV